MAKSELLHEDVQKLLDEGKLEGPLRMFAQVMLGQDPRHIDVLAERILEINEFGYPDEDDWEQLVAFAETRYKHRSVDIKTSMDAAKSLAEYLHPKRKALELTGNIDAGVSAKISPLTEEEVEIFKEKFDGSF